MTGSKCQRLLTRCLYFLNVKIITHFHHYCPGEKIHFTEHTMTFFVTTAGMISVRQWKYAIELSLFLRYSFSAQEYTFGGKLSFVLSVIIVYKYINVNFCCSKQRYHFCMITFLMFHDLFCISLLTKTHHKKY